MRNHFWPPRRISRAYFSVWRSFQLIIVWSPTPPVNTEMNASCGMFTLPMAFMRFLPSFCFSQSLRLRVMSPP
jgi:hypothetical protein